MAYAAKVDIKARIPILTTDTSQDAFIDTLCLNVKAVIDSYCDNTFESVNATRKFDMPRRSRRLLLDEWMLTCTSVTNGNGVLIPATEYILEDYNNPPYYAIVLTPITSYYWLPDTKMNPQRAITVVGTWGYTATAPLDIQEAAQRLVVSWFRSRDGLNAGPTRAIVTAAGVEIASTTFPEDVAELLAPYKRIALSTQIGRTLGEFY
jgi:hypothetical protein